MIERETTPLRTQKTTRLHTPGTTPLRTQKTTRLWTQKAGNPQAANQRSQRKTGRPVVLIVLLVAAIITTAFTLGQGSDDNETGAIVFDRVENEVLHEDGADTQFRSASLVKMLIGIDLVRRDIVTPQKPSPKMTRMLSHSDDEIATELWLSGGGPQIVTRTAEFVGLHDTEPPSAPGRWGDTLITANDILKVHQYILALPPPERDLLLGPLRDAARTAADGSDQHFGIPNALPDKPWAIKQGWASGRGGVDAHTSGIVGDNDRYIVVVLTHHPEGYSLPIAERKVTDEVADLAATLE